MFNATFRFTIASLILLKHLLNIEIVDYMK